MLPNPFILYIFEYSNYVYSNILKLFIRVIISNFLKNYLTSIVTKL